MIVGIAAIVLAAGESRRMGRPKLLLPWRETTVLGQVLQVFASGLEGSEVVVVTGGARAEVKALVGTMAGKSQFRTVYNPEFAQGGMLSSLQAGLRALDGKVKAALIGLGDQPQVKESTIRAICSEYARKPAPLIIPSFEGHRGHPWLVSRPLWDEVLALPAYATPRDFLNAHKNDAIYIDADNSILQDLDTPEDYRRMRP